MVSVSWTLFKGMVTNYYSMAPWREVFWRKVFCCLGLWWNRGALGFTGAMLPQGGLSL